MNEKTMLIILILICVVFSVILVAVILIGQKRSKNQVQSDFAAEQTASIRLYYKIRSWPLVGSYIRRIRMYVEMIDLSDQNTIDRKTMKIGSISVGGTAFLMFLLLLLDQDIHFVVIGIVIIMMIHEQIVHMLIDRMDDKLLNQFMGFISDVRHHYNEHQMIDEAIYDAIQSADYEMARHGTWMYEVLTEDGMDIDDYYETAPNRYFKSFVALGFLVMKFGDTRTGGVSSFLKNLNFLKQEISMALLRREKLNYLLSSLTLISVLPLFLVKPLESWAINSMPELMNYYEGVYGFVVQIVLFILIVLSYQLVVRLKNREETFLIAERRNKSMMLRIGFIRRMVNRLITFRYSHSEKLSRRLKMIGSRISVEQLFGRQLDMAVLVFLVGIIAVLNLHQIERVMILNPPYMDEGKNVEAELLLREKDAVYVRAYGMNDKLAIKEHLAEDMNTHDDAVLEIHYQRIIEKINAIEGAHFKWWEMILVIALSLIGFVLPRAMIAFRRRIMVMHMEDEVLQFHTIILMLMHIDRVSVCDLLEWMSLFAIIFKEDIDECINDLELGDYEALETLKQKVSYQPFVRIIDNLQATADKIPIEEAFDELLVERGFYQEKRKQDTEILVDRKGTWGKMIAFVPMFSTIILFLLVPFTHLGMSQFGHYITQISEGI